MAKLLKIGIVGCGAIGTSLAKAIRKDFSKSAKLAALFDIEYNKAHDLSHLISSSCNLAAKDLKTLILSSDLVIEASSAKSSFQIARHTLSKKKSVMIMSVGGIVSRLKELKVLAGRADARIYIPSGAICGIDGLKAVNLGKIKKVTLTTRKNPGAFKGVECIKKKGINLSKIKTDRLLFSGSAKQAVEFFPQNINVAGILSLAGIGEAKTKVIIIASPSAKKNIHEIEIDSSVAKIFTRSENILHPDNPKTSFLAVL
jgi:aspartate dehydrogenase